MRIKDNPVPIYIMSCYAYEELNDSFISDTTFDMLSRYLADNWGNLKHRHKHLIDEEGCAYTSSLTVSYDDLPNIIKETTKQILKDKNENSFVW